MSQQKATNNPINETDKTNTQITETSEPPKTKLQREIERLGLDPVTAALAESIDSLHDSHAFVKTWLDKGNFSSLKNYKPSPQIWARLYRSQGRIKRNLIMPFAYKLMSIFSLVEIQAFMQSDEMPDDMTKRIASALGIADISHDDLLSTDTLKKLLQVNDLNDPVQCERFFFAVDMILFVSVVFIPLFLLSDTFPTLLLRKARLGDVDALEKILKWDKTIFAADPKVTQAWAKIISGNSEHKRKCMLAAISGKPDKHDWNMARFKRRWAALIKTSDQFSNKKNVTYNEILRLFNLAAEERGQFCDPTFGDDEGAFERSVRKEIKALRAFVGF